MYLSFQFQMSKKEREICEFKMDVNDCFVCALIYKAIIMITQFLPKGQVSKWVWILKV